MYSSTFSPSLYLSFYFNQQFFFQHVFPKKANDMRRLEVYHILIHTKNLQFQNIYQKRVIGKNIQSKKLVLTTKRQNWMLPAQWSVSVGLTTMARRNKHCLKSPHEHDGYWVQSWTPADGLSRGCYELNMHLKGRVSIKWNIPHL